MVSCAEKMSAEEKERIIHDFLPFIRYTAYRFSWRLPSHLNIQDLISVGIMGLLDALGRYQTDRAKLNTFAESRIRGAMLDELRAHDWLPRSRRTRVDEAGKAYRQLEKELGRAPEDTEVAERLGISLDEYYKTLQCAHMQVPLRFENGGEREVTDGSVVFADSVPDPDAKTPLALYEEKRKKEALAQLISGLPEKEKIVLSLYYWDEMTMKEIACILSLTEGRVSQLHHQALMRLKANIDF